MFKRKTVKKGFSVVEVILAVFRFINRAPTGVAHVIPSFSVNRQAEEETQATLIAQEGIEGVRSIKNQSWGNLTSGTYGLDTTGNVWSFDAGPDPLGKFSRTIVISDVQRDVGGNIVASGGTPDPDAKKIDATVDWDFSDVRARSITLATYLTNFRKAISSAGDALLVYGRTGSSIPRFNVYSNASNTFSANSDTVAGAPGRNFVIKT